MHPARRGFSLIELMIVVAIISVLAAIAFPSYQVYLRKARFAEVVSATEIFKIAITLALQEGINKDELINGKHGIPEVITPTHNLASILADRGTIIATASKLINEVTYILKPNEDGTQWKVSGSCLKKGYCHDA